MRTLLQKLKSTKLWCAIAGIATGICIALGADATDVQIISGAVTSLVSLVTYIVTEGRIDEAAVAQTVKQVGDAAAVIGGDGNG